MNQLAVDHLERLRVALLQRYSMSMLAEWIERNTFIGGRPYSYLHHEYQQVIAQDNSQEVAVRKCSQVGVSEVSARLALGMVSVVSPMTAIYTLPTAKFAATFMKTRIDPVIHGSKVLREAIHKTNDNSEIKQFGDSFLYVKGAASSNAPISIPADAIINDECDFCDQEVLTQYTSRLTHSQWRLIKKFSTPTLPGYGVDKAFQESRRHYNLCCCDHCGHWFQPSYYDHVHIPGFTGDLREINKQTLTRIRWKEAAVICPKCGKAPSLEVEHRRYVCENPTENYVCAGYQVSPFDAPRIITPSYLVEASTKYARNQDFVNFALGLPADDAEATLSRADFTGVFVQAEPGARWRVMGVDVGSTYHFVVGEVDGYGAVFVVHTERVPMGLARKRYADLRSQWRPGVTVIDSGPHAETVMALQDEDPNLYAAVYVARKTILTHVVKDREEEEDDGKAFVRQVDVNRSRALDAYMLFIREGNLSIRLQDDEETETIISHHCSMKRVKVFDSESDEMSYSWQKTDGNDHYHHAFLYCWIASRIKGIGRPLVELPLFKMFKFKMKADLTES